MAVENLDDLNITVANLLRTASGYNRMVLANQGESPPPSPYGTYWITPVRAYGQPKRVRTDIPAVEPVPEFEWQDMQETLITSMEMMVSVNFFDKGARQAAHNMQQAQYRAPVSDYCYLNGIGWRYVSEARNLTGIEMANMQERYQIDLHLWVETQVSDTLLRAAGFIVEVYDENEHLLSSTKKTTGA